MKNNTGSIIIALSALILFLAGLTLGTNQGININVSSEIEVNSSGSDVVDTQTVTQAAVATTQAATTQAAVVDTTTATQETTAASSDTATDTETEAETQAETQEDTTDSLPTTTAEIADLYNELINTLKTVDYVEIVKEQTLPVSVTECSISMATSLVDSAIALVLVADSWEDTFTNGVSSSGRTLDGSISPYNRDCALVAEALESASCTANADGGYTIELQFVYETSSYDGVSNTPEQTYHQTALDPIDLSTMEIPAVTILSADMYYNGATVTMIVDADSNVVSHYSYLPLGGSGVGKLALFEPTVGIDGYTETTFTFTY